jgi:DNA mismatch repair protein MutL
MNNSTRTIKQLSEDTINQIAAGEVIERPSSVLKEMMENAIDAGATEITIVIREGGRDYIRISDNGKGIPASDLDLCFARHATSKINDAQDLFAIQSNGFRGEALSSIAAISRVTLETAVKDQSAWKMIVEGGVEIMREEIARNTGTSFTVENLFFNTPVRKKFLSSAQTETRRITEIVTRIALAHPNISFSLSQGIKELYQSPAGTLENRVASIFGVKTTNQLIACESIHEDMKVYGLISPPELHKGRRSQQFFYVNKRPVWNAFLSSALSRAYKDLAPGRHPLSVLFLELASDDFDVNVHPQKKEVRFSRENLVYSTIHRAVREALRTSTASPGLTSSISSPPFSENPHISITEDEKEVSFPAPRRPANDPIVNNNKENYTTPNNSPINEESSQENNLSIEDDPWGTINDSDKSASDQESFAHFEAPLPPIPPIPPEEIYSVQEPDLFTQAKQKIIPLQAGHFKQDRKEDIPDAQSGSFYQISDTYILCESDQAILLMHQNAAHQRILYEEALERLASHSTNTAATLLFPEVVELSPAEAQLCDEYADEIKTLGFTLEDFGGNTKRITAAPENIAPEHTQQAIMDLLHDLENKTTGKPQEKAARAYALSSSIRSGTRLSQARMAALWDSLWRCESPLVSPFGIPTLLRIPFDDLERRFQKK